jgi:hypothetical protein
MTLEHVVSGRQVHDEQSHLGAFRNNSQKKKEDDDSQLLGY